MTRLKVFLLLVCLAVGLFQSDFDLAENVKRKNLSPAQIEQMDFDWVAYLNMYPDIQSYFNDKNKAWAHYDRYGRKESRRFPSKRPDTSSLQSAQEKITSTLLNMEKRNVAVIDRTLVMYYLPSAEDRSVEVLVNTVRIFTSALASDKFETSHNFYWINVASTSKNSYMRYFSTQSDHVALINWSQTSTSQSLLILHTLELLHNEGVFNHFGSVLFLDADTRGPFIYRKEGRWAQVYRNLLYRPHELYNFQTPITFSRHNIGVAGSTISCEGASHVQNYSFIIRSELVPTMLQALNPPSVTYQQFRDNAKYNSQYFGLLARKKHNITSLMYIHNDKGEYFKENCLSAQEVCLKLFDKLYSAKHSSNNHNLSLSLTSVSDSSLSSMPMSQNPLHWCIMNISSLIFYPWGGDRFHQLNAQVCKYIKMQMYAQLATLSTKHGLDLHMQETFFKFRFYDLSLQYDAEVYGYVIIQKHHYMGYGLKDIYKTLHHSSQEEISMESTVKGERKDNKANSMKASSHNVCLLVRSSISLIDDTPDYPINSTHLPDYFDTYDHLIQSLLRQSDQNWMAYFFLTDSVEDKDNQLNFLLQSYGDKRLQYLALNDKDNVDVITRTDAALKLALSFEHCQFVSITNNKNIYGKEVLAQVRQSIRNDQHPYTLGNGKKRKKGPTDKANSFNASNAYSILETYLYEQYNNLHIDMAQHTLVKMIYMPIDTKYILYHVSQLRKENLLRKGICASLFISLSINVLGMARQPEPLFNHTDISAIFFVREELAKENVFLSHFTPLTTKAKGCFRCQELYLIEYLTNRLHWRALKLPLSGLQDIVFHAPSPLWCLASGNTWLGDSDAERARCITSQTMNLLAERGNAERMKYDWGDSNHHLCLAYSQAGYQGISSRNKNG